GGERGRGDEGRRGGLPDQALRLRGAPPPRAAPRGPARRAEQGGPAGGEADARPGGGERGNEGRAGRGPAGGRDRRQRAAPGRERDGEEPAGAPDPLFEQARGG